MPFNFQERTKSNNWHESECEDKFSHPQRDDKSRKSYKHRKTPHNEKPLHQIRKHI